MPDFFTLIALVLGVSGSTYTAIAGIHSVWTELVLERLERSRFCRKHIDEIGTQETKHKARKDYWHFRIWNWAWRIAYSIPNLIFVAFAFYAAFDFCLDFYRNGTNSSGTWTWNPQKVGPFYMYVLAGITAIDAVCIVLTFISYWGIYSASERLESGVRQCDELLEVKKESGTLKVDVKPTPTQQTSPAPAKT